MSAAVRETCDVANTSTSTNTNTDMVFRFRSRQGKLPGTSGGGGTKGKGRGGRGRSGGGRKGGGCSKITLSDPMVGLAPSVAAARTAPGFGPLDLVRSNVPQHLDIPAVEGVETYLASLANPARDLATMRVRAWRRTTV